MSRKDYKVIAAAIREELSYYESHLLLASTIRCMARTIASHLQADNPKFNTDLFLKEAGVR